MMRTLYPGMEMVVRLDTVTWRPGATLVEPRRECVTRRRLRGSGGVESVAARRISVLTAPGLCLATHVPRRGPGSIHRCAHPSR